MSEFVFSLYALPIGLVVTMFLTSLVMRVGVQRGVLDVPGERSSHSSPVPRGGGVAVIITFYVFLFVYPRIVDVSIDLSVLVSLSLGGALVAAVGFFDDLKSIAAKWRFLTHLGAAVLSLILLPSLPDIMIFGQSFDLGLFAYVFLAISLVWFVNLFNFMDGIDGIAGVETITVLLSAALILFVQGDVAWLTLFSFLAACVAGFLIWNWPPAKVFMGDACSGFLGFALGFFAIVTSLEGMINLWTWLILCGVFVLDATTTLITRIARGEKWYEAHRSHAYQIMSRRVESHKTVTVGVMIINLLWLLPLGYLSAIYPFWALLVCITALLPLLMLAVYVGAGTNRASNGALE